MPKNKGSWDEMDIIINYISIVHTPYYHVSGISHAFYTVQPLYIDWEYRRPSNGRTVWFSEDKQMDEWGQYLLPEQFLDPVESPLVAHLLQDFAEAGWKLWYMTRKWKNSETGNYFLDPYPRIYEFIFPLHPDIEKPSREYITYLLSVFDTANESDRLLTPANHKTRKVNK